MPYKRRHPVPESEIESQPTSEELQACQEAIKLVEPIDEREMWWRERYATYHTICMTLRDIYRITQDEDIKIKCRLAMAMAKAMNAKLQWYKERDLQAEREKNGAVNSDSSPK